MSSFDNEIPYILRRFLCNVNFRPLGYFINEIDLVINQPIYGQLIVIGCHYAQISNQIISSASTGITVEFSDFVTVSKNIVTNNDDYYGIIIRWSYAPIITENLVIDNTYGIYTLGCYEAVITKNIMIGNGLYIAGIWITDYELFIVENNSVNGKGIGFFVSKENLVLNKKIYGQFILVNCTNIEISNQKISRATCPIVMRYCNDIVIHNNNFNDNFGAIISFSSDGLSIINNKLSDGSYGLYIYGTANSEFINNKVSNNDRSGILLYFPYNCLVENNKVFRNKNSDGINIYQGQDVTVIDNKCFDNDYAGISVGSTFNGLIIDNVCERNWMGLTCYEIFDSVIINNELNNNIENGIDIWTSFNSVIDQNTCNDNGYHGIALADAYYTQITNNNCTLSGTGIHIGISSDCLIDNNFLKLNSMYGIFFYWTSYSTITNNQIIGNNLEGIYLMSDCEGNIIYNNAFIDNNLFGYSQAYDEGFNNLWYDPINLVGNYWSDYIGSGYYYIDGWAGSYDPYPLLFPP